MGARGAFRLVGLHPCPDYEVMHYGDDAEARDRERDKLQRYDEIMAESLQVNLLERGLPALIFTGIAHSTAKFPEYWEGADKQLVRMGNMIFTYMLRSGTAALRKRSTLSTEFSTG
jgi:hypothetical protein